VELNILTSQKQQLISEVDDYLKRLFPITRSITGDGNRETLRILQELIQLEIKEYPSGTEVYDWTIPDEWNVKDAWIKDANGNKLVDLKQSNIHLVSYSETVHKKITFQELKERLHTHPDLPDAIPYRTTYYKRDWGFSVTHKQYLALENAIGLLEVKIDSSFKSDGGLSIGEMLIPGISKKEILISTYICHPSLANDNLSGALMTAFLARYLLKQKNNWSYRIVWIPETIGAIAYCAMNESVVKNIDMGLVITTVGGPGSLGYKQSWQSDHPINKIVEEVLSKDEKEFFTYPFDIHGSDERQYSSQGFRINMATISKDHYYEYPQYHTSLDNLSFVNGKQIVETLGIYTKVIKKIEERCIYRKIIPNCEVMLSKHDLYPKHGGMFKPDVNGYTELDTIMWFLFYCDGQLTVNEIANKINVDAGLIEKVRQLLESRKVIERI
jgi:aminopeptidase-like protein